MRATITAGLMAALAASSIPAWADTAGVYLGTGTWSQDPNGDLRYQGDEIDVDDDLNLGSERQGYAWLALEHPVPLLPNIRLSGVNVQTQGRGSVTTSFDFGGQTFNVSEDIDSDVRLDQRDATLYYEILDNVVSIDLGLNIKYIDGDARIRSLTTATEASAAFNAYLPMAYGRLAADLPFTGLSAGIEGSAVSYDGNHLVDYTLRAAYESKYRIGLEAGYRRQQLKLDDVDEVFTDLGIEGVFVGVFAHF